MLHQRKSGAMGVKSGEKSQWGQKESQGCPQIRSVPVAMHRTVFLYLPCPGCAETSKQTQVLFTEKERCFFCMQCILPPT